MSSYRKTNKKGLITLSSKYYPKYFLLKSFTSNKGWSTGIPDTQFFRRLRLITDLSYNRKKCLRLWINKSVWYFVSSLPLSLSMTWTEKMIEFPAERLDLEKVSLPTSFTLTMFDYYNNLHVSICTRKYIFQLLELFSNLFR